MKKIIIILSLFVAFTGCKKENPTTPKQETPYIKVPDEVWNYIKLSPGAWYIYKDSASGLTDSINVTISTVNYKAPTYGNYFGYTALAYYNDDYALALEKVDPSGAKTVWLSASSRSIIYSTVSNQNYWEFLSITGNMVLFQYPSNLSGSVTNYKITSALIEGNTYSDIQVMRNNAVSGSSEVWWVRDLGIVKLTRSVAGEIKTSLLLRKK